ncbi:MAG: hypothetical protein QGH94_06670 [Phycisphaerae bacterium]|nr:hypothetical protein [Phycisphaerae bacterium]
MIPLYVTGGQMVQGLDFYIQIGDGGTANGGSGIKPVISNVDIVGPGTLFNQSNTGQLNTFASDLLWAVSTTTDPGTVDEIAADGLLAYVTIDAAGTVAGESYPLLLTGVAEGIFGPPGVETGFAGVSAAITNGVLNVGSGVETTARHVFYNNSLADGNNGAGNAADDSAVDSSKTALLPGQTVTSANYTSYSRGINGVMVDIAGLDAGYDPVAGDFGVRVSHADTGAWSTGPAPSVSVRRDDGVGGSDRVTLIWPDGAVANQWIEITVKSDVGGGGLGLVGDDLFYFGNSAGDIDGDAAVDDADLALLKSEFGLSGGGLAADFDGDDRVSLGDFTIMRSRFGETVEAPVFPPAAPLAVPAPAAEIEAGLDTPGLTTSVNQVTAIGAPIAPPVVNPASVSLSQVALPVTGASPSPAPSVELELLGVLPNEVPAGDLDASLDTDGLLVDVLAEAVSSQFSTLS